ncbi:CDP-diacylglycerol--serine O-phosphatidyltransferase [Bacteroidia bacterium]|nr:CDP-diacylglycerol--serine O-phosphatidyltransferase [Bacteroidia bacterium]
MKKHIPNILTLCNLFCGSIAVVQIINNNILWACGFVLLAGIFDLFDGMTARALHVSSPIGVELDSLADMVSFGFVPGFIAYRLMKCEMLVLTNILPEWLLAILPFTGFLITAFSALRLAKFNVSEENTVYFTGVPTPANALFWTAMLMAYWHHDIVVLPGSFYAIVFHPLTLIALALVMSYLLISPLKLFTLKFKSLKNIGQYWQVLTVIWIALILLYFIGITAIPVTILLAYPLVSWLKFRKIK